MSQAVVRLGDVLEVQNGYAFSSDFFATEAPIGLIRIRDLKRGTSTEIGYVGDYDDDYVVKAGDLLVGMDGEFRCYRWSGAPALLNQRVCRLRNFDSRLEPGYLLYSLDFFLKKIEDETGYVTVKHLSSKTITNIEMALPTVAEQRRIVSLLDAATQHITDLEFAFAQTVGRYEELASSAVRRAFEPTPDVRLARLQDVAEVNPSEPALSEDSPFVPMDAVHVGKRDIQYTEPRGTRSGARARAGDVLFARITPCLQNGKVALVQDEFPRCGGSTEFIVVRAGSELLREYLYYWITSPRVRELAVSMMTGATGRQRLNAPDLAALEIPVPALSEQRRVVMELDDLDVVVSGGVSLARQRLDRAVDLRQSVLEAAFRGEL